MREVRPKPEITRAEPPLLRADVADWLRATLRAGDSVLSACRDSLSLIIRWGTMSDFSHIALALNSDQLIESYDWAGTPSDEDGGVGRLSVQRYADRGSLRNLAILRPKGLDPEAFEQVVDHATHHSPPFASSTGVLLALAGLGDHPNMTVPGVRAYIEKRLHLLGDGAARVTCAEFVARVYLESGVDLRFQTLRLLSYVELLRTGKTTAQLRDHRTPRRVDVAADARLEPTTLPGFARQFPQAVSAPPSRRRIEPDWADMLMPGDFLLSSCCLPASRSSPFVGCRSD